MITAIELLFHGACVNGPPAQPYAFFVRPLQAVAVSEVHLGGVGSAVRFASVDAPPRACLLVTVVDGMVAVQDAGDPHRSPFLYTRAEWDAFLTGAKAGEFDHLVET